jgi:hypothetical protein
MQPSTRRNQIAQSIVFPLDERGKTMFYGVGGLVLLILIILLIVYLF